MEFVTDWLASMFYYPLSMLTEIGTTAQEVMSTSSDTAIGTISKTMSTASTNFMPCLQSFGYAISIMFFIFSLIDLCLKDGFTTEMFIKHFAYLAVGIGMVYYSKDFFNAIVNLGNTLSDFIATNFVIDSTTTVPSEDTFKEAFSTMLDTDTGLLSGISAILKIMLAATIGSAFALIEILAALILKVVVYVIAVTRLVELNVRGCFLPVGLSLMSDDGYRGAGGRYLKRFIAVACQGAVITIIGKVATSCISIAVGQSVTILTDTTFSDNFMTSLFSMIGSFILALAVAVAMVSAMFKSIQLTNDIFGA